MGSYLNCREDPDPRVIVKMFKAGFDPRLLKRKEFKKVKNHFIEVIMDEKLMLLKLMLQKKRMQSKLARLS